MFPLLDLEVRHYSTASAKLDGVIAARRSQRGLADAAELREVALDHRADGIDTPCLIQGVEFVGEVHLDLLVDNRGSDLWARPGCDLDDEHQRDCDERRSEQTISGVPPVLSALLAKTEDRVPGERDGDEREGEDDARGCLVEVRPCDGADGEGDDERDSGLGKGHGVSGDQVGIRAAVIRRSGPPL